MRLPLFLSTLSAATLLIAAPASATVLGCSSGHTVSRAMPSGWIGAVDEVDDLIAEGRKLLALKKATEAEGLFNQAAELDGNSFRTRMWVLRSWMDQGGRSNDTLNALDDLSKTHDGPDIDYLYGMAWARRAEEQVQMGAVQAVNMNFGTAIELLGKALEVDPDRYADAYLALARSAWYQSELDTARSAAEEALRRFPKDAECAFELGRIALSQFTVAQADPEAEDLANRHWETARDAFERAVELSGRPNKRDWRGMSLLGQAHLQLAHTLMWREQADVARPAYAQALAWYPDAVDCGQLFNMLGLEGFSEVLEEAQPAFADRFGKDDHRDAPMLWWLGYTRFMNKKPAEAEAAFALAVEKVPTYVNAHFYIALSRYDQKNYDGAREALLTGWDTDPSVMVGAMSSNVSMNTAKVEYLIGPLVESGRFADAAILAEMCAEAAQTEARHWNNMGFFLREEGIRLSQVADENERAGMMDVFEDSLTAYERAVDLAPEDPTYLNDTAVILHYYLDREHERALAMYDAAAEYADARIQAGGLSPEAMDLTRTALRDATNNRRALKKLMDQRAREEAKKKAAEEEAAGEREGEEEPGEGGMARDAA